MEEIEVTARFDSQGNIFPLRFIWRDRTYRVDSIGRRWTARDGVHILVMDPGKKTFHLIFKPETAKWFIFTGGNIPTTPSV